jgi:hypothetical protein
MANTNNLASVKLSLYKTTWYLLVETTFFYVKDNEKAHHFQSTCYSLTYNTFEMRLSFDSLPSKQQLSITI